MPVTISRDQRIVALRSDRGCYAFSWNAVDTPLQHLHWGGPVTDDDLVALRDSPQLLRRPTSTAAKPRAIDEEYPVWGGLRREEVALKIEMPDGVRSLDLTVTDVAAFDIVPEPLHTDCGVTVTLADRHYPVRVELTWSVDAAGGAVVRSAAVTNNGSEPLHIDQAFSASWALPRRPDPSLLALTGMYGAETRRNRTPLPVGRYTVESRAGIPGHDATLFLAVAAPAGEESGEVWSVAVAWSGSFKIVAQRADDDAVHIVGGINDVDLRHALPPGATRRLPPMIGIYSDAGWTGMTSRWHAYQRAQVVVQPQRDRPVLYNSWEAAYFAVSFHQQQQLAATAADLGVELFVIDDGWFTGRSTDEAGLGDWSVDRRKFPDGLRPLSDQEHSLGMQFGLWVEPEMVNQDSELFRAHPDWVYRWPTREPTRARHQLMLDFCRPEIQDWAIDVLDGLIADLGLDYLKWDMNRPLAEPDSPAVAGGGAVWVEHVRGVYRAWDVLRERHPHLWIETCASGGGRADLGALARTHWAWPSDNTDPVDRLLIQDGFTTVNLPMSMANWVTDSPTPLGQRLTPLRFRFCPTVLHTSARQLIRWRGLDPAAAYRAIDTGSGRQWRHSGAFLHNHGILVELAGSFASTMITLDRYR